MPIVNSKGEVLSEKEIKAAARMIQGSLQARLDKIIYDSPEGEELDFNADPSGNIVTTTIEMYKNAIKTAESRYRELNRGDEVIKIEELLNHEEENLDKEIFKDREYDFEKDPYAYRMASAGWNSDYGTNQFMTEFQRGEYTEEKIKRNSFVGYNISAKNFKLPDKAIDGMDKIVDFNIESEDVRSMYKERMGNSTTLKVTEAQLRADIEKEENVGRKEELKNKIDEVQKDGYSFRSSTEVVLEQASKLADSEKITAGDLFETFSEINQVIRLGSGDGGALRGRNVGFSGLRAPEPGSAAGLLYKTLDDIADNMNKIKQTEDPALRKTQALYLASFTYQMTISEHVFDDGNGRSCRLLTDTILQAFGLPPHIPDEREQHLSNGFGNELDFDKGAKLIFEGVKKSNAIVEQDRKDRANIVQETKKVDTEFHKVEDAKFKKNFDLVTDDYVKKIGNLSKDAHRVRGIIHNSKEYDIFESTLKVKYELTKLVNNAKKNNENSIDISKLPDSIRKSAIIAAREESTSESIDIKDCGKMLTNINRNLVNVSKNYMKYKFKTHSENPDLEPGKLPLNADDKAKLELIERVLPAGKYKELRENIAKQEREEAIGKEQEAKNLQGKQNVKEDVGLVQGK